MVRSAIGLVDLTVSPQIGDNREVTAAAIGLAGVGLLACVAVHVCLKRARASEALIADLALVFLLRG